MYYNKDEMNDFDNIENYKNDRHKIITKIISVIIVIVFIIILFVIQYRFDKEEFHNYITHNIQVATVTDMTIGYDDNGNSEYEMKVKLDNGENCTIIINQGNFIKYKIGDVVSIEDKRYLYN